MRAGWTCKPEMNIFTPHFVTAHLDVERSSRTKAATCYLTLFGNACRYNPRAKKSYKVIITQAQDKVLQPPSVSYEADVLQTFKVLSRHMPPNSGDGHLFLSPIRDSRTVVSCFSLF